MIPDADAGVVADPPANSSRLLEPIVPGCKRRRRMKGPPASRTTAVGPSVTHPGENVDQQREKSVIIQDKPLYVHSMIRTCRVKCNSDTAPFQEQFAIPPAQVESTTGSVLGVSLVRCLTEYVFAGLSYRLFLETFVVGCFGGVMWKIIMDSAASNLWMTAMLGPALQVIGQSLGLLTMFWCEPCALHQLARITIMTLTACSVISPLYAFSRALNKGRNVKRLREGLQKLVQDTLDYREHQLPPDTCPPPSC